MYIDTDPVSEVRRNREALPKKYGSIDGLHKHMDEQRPELEKKAGNLYPSKKCLQKNVRISTTE